MPTYEANGLDSVSIRQMVNELKKERTVIKRCVNDVCMRLANIGMNRANQDFASVLYQGEKDYAVTVEPLKDGAKLSATGETVYFLEYGSGAFQPSYAGETPLGLERGSWSLSEKGKGHWDDPRGWYVSHGVKSWGNPPANAMYHAEQDIKRNADRVIQEVLNKS